MKTKKKCVTSIKKQKEAKIKDFISIIILHDYIKPKSRIYDPISLLSINNDKLIDRQIASIKNAFENFEIIISTGQHSSKIYHHVIAKYKDLNIRVVENSNFEQSNTCDNARICLQNTTNDKILIIDNRLLFGKDLFSKIKFDKSFVLSGDSNETLEIGFNINENNTVEYFTYGAKECWSEIIFINGKKAVLDLYETLSRQEYRNKFLFEAFNSLIVKHKFEKVKHKSKVIKIKNIKTYYSIKD
jgi:hypothetical protein